jgi:hypothetical protein
MVDNGCNNGPATMTGEVGGLEGWWPGTKRREKARWLIGTMSNGQKTVECNGCNGL